MICEGVTWVPHGLKTKNTVRTISGAKNTSGRCANGINKFILGDKAKSIIMYFTQTCSVGLWRIYSRNGDAPMILKVRGRQYTLLQILPP